MTRREAVVVLLLHLADTRSGLWDARSDGGGLPLMCSVWRHPSFQQLERLLLRLRRADPRAWRAVHALYEEPSFRRRAWCPRCGFVGPSALIGAVHGHGRRSTALVAKMAREPLLPVGEADVARGVDWLEAHWRGGVFIPDELRDVAAVA